VPNNAKTKTVSFTSSDTDVATVDETGLVTAGSTGASTTATATITVTTTDGGFTDTCVVTVNEASA
jgi:uncharacterized protein YjdB